jgi:3-oxoacyl-[acyl-carrier protein] reductase
MKQLEEEKIAVDLLIHNAGISHIGLTQDMSVALWQQLINTNLNSAFYFTKALIPQMVAKQDGRILFISSVWGTCGASCETAYSASKGGLNTFTKALAKELAPSHIAVNAIACGAIDTEMNSFLSPEEKAALEAEIPAGRMGLPEEVASFALQLASAPEYLTGQVIGFDGAWL